MKRQSFKQLALMLFSFTLFFVISCRKDLADNEKQFGKEGAGSKHGHLKQTKTFSSDVAVKWLDVQLNMLRVPQPPGVGSQAADRCLSYCGIALYEAVVPGMPAYQSLGGQLIEFPRMPETKPGFAYHWAAAANAALADMNRKLFPTASAQNLAAVDELEHTLETQYAGEVDAATLQRSIDFGKAISTAVFKWAVTDGVASMPPASTYLLPVGEGLWEKTPPNFAGPANPFPNMRRFLVAGSDEGSTPQAPPPYSINPASEFYAMAKDVYDRSLTLTAADSAKALYHRDAPGYPGGGTAPAFLSQIIQTAGCSLDIAALAYAKSGIGIADALNLCFRVKYRVNQVRPITYIRNVLMHKEWNALFPTPGHPEFPAAHATNGGAFTAMLVDVFGDHFSFRFDHYAYLNLPARSYGSLQELGQEMSDSRPLGGVHYQASCDKGLIMGRKIAANVLARVKFLK